MHNSYQADLFAHNIVEEKSNSHTTHKKIMDEIKTFNRANLRKRSVYMVGGPPEKYLPSCLHSFPIIGAMKTNTHKAYGSLRYLSANIMLGQYVVSDTIVKYVIKSSHFHNKTKAAIQKLRGHSYPSVENFFRALLKEREGEKIDEAILFEMAAFPDLELQKLAKLNEDLNYERGVVTPGNPDEGRRKKDRARFENSSRRLTIVPYPNIEPDTLDDVFNQLKLYTAWMNEQAGVGKNTEYWIKKHVHPEKTKQIIDSMVHYKSLSPNPIFNLLGASLLQFLTLPNKNLMFETNCNKSSASLLHEAENRSAEKQTRRVEEVRGPTWIHQHIGSSQRIPIWNPLRPNFIGIIRQLVHPTGVNYPVPSLAELIKNKKNILSILKGFELEDQIKTLEQITNPNTLLGKAFANKKVSFLFNSKSEDLITAERMLADARHRYIMQKDEITNSKLQMQEARAKHTKEIWQPTWDAMKPK